MHPKSVQLAMQTAIQFGQLIKLITPLAQTSKALSKPLARLLSHVQSRVAIISNTTVETVARIESGRLNAGYALLSDGVKAYLCAEKLLRASVSYKHVYFSQVRMSARSQHELTLLVNRIAEDPITPVSLDPARDAQSRHLYASLVRNANWLPIIADLGTKLSVTDKALLNGELIKRHASHQGIALYSQRLALLTGAIEPNVAKKKASGATRKTTATKAATRTQARRRRRSTPLDCIRIKWCSISTKSWLTLRWRHSSCITLRLRGNPRSPRSSSTPPSLSSSRPMCPSSA